MGEKKIEAVSAPENPYSKGSATANTRYHVGDSYTYRLLDLFTRALEREFTLTITEITDTQVIYNGGRVVTDLLGNPVRSGDGREYSPNQNYPAEFAVGRRWVSRFTMTMPKGPVDTELELRITGRERIRVPAGEFDTFVVEANGRASLPGIPFPMRSTAKAWFAPEKSRQPIAREQVRQAPNGRVVSSERQELVAFRQA
jgi:hypothetical protein